MALRDRVHIHQIYYSEETFRGLDPGFIPLDNMANERPDWYEFWPIRNYLNRTPLLRGHWYGFLSPKFGWKAGLSSAEVYAFIEASRDKDVALLSPGWDQIFYFQNLFEQGNHWHPGLLEQSQEFLRQAGVRISLRRLVTHSGNSVFSNYFVARAQFWVEWLELANLLFDYAESAAGAELSSHTWHGTGAAAPMKTFVQERFASLILSAGAFSIAALDRSHLWLPTPSMFIDNPPTRKTLKTLDTLKQKFVETDDDRFLASFRQLRAGMRLADGALPA